MNDTSTTKFLHTLNILMNEHFERIKKGYDAVVPFTNMIAQLHIHTTINLNNLPADIA